MAPTDDLGSDTAPHSAPASKPSNVRKTLIFANDKSSGKTTTASAVLVSLIDRYPLLMRAISVREYDRHPLLATIFSKEDGIASMEHHDARNSRAFDQVRELSHDPNATAWDELLSALGNGGMVVNLGTNIFAEICRILDEEPRPIFPDDGQSMGVVIPMTTAADSIDSGISAIETA